jgi:hypothetical protein
MSFGDRALPPLLLPLRSTGERDRCRSNLDEYADGGGSRAFPGSPNLASRMGMAAARRGGDGERLSFHRLLLQAPRAKLFPSPAPPYWSNKDSPPPLLLTKLFLEDPSAAADGAPNRGVSAFRDGCDEYASRSEPPLLGSLPSLVPLKSTAGACR